MQGAKKSIEVCRYKPPPKDFPLFLITFFIILFIPVSVLVSFSASCSCLFPFGLLHLQATTNFKSTVHKKVDYILSLIFHFINFIFFSRGWEGSIVLLCTGLK
jgi:hypothetical protein